MKRQRTRADIALAELRWYYTQSESAIGVKSAMGAMLNRAAIGFVQSSTVQTDNMTLSRLKAAARRRRIEHALSRIPASYRRVLAAAYEARRYPVGMHVHFGDACGVVLSLPLARRLYRYANSKRQVRERGMMDWLCRIGVSGNSQEVEWLQVMVQKSVELLKTAHKTFEKAMV